MDILRLQRVDENVHRTPGSLLDPRLIDPLVTLELPFRNNEHKVSRILAGTYPCELEYSHSHGYAVYWLRHVPGRDSVELHIGNFVMPPKVDSDGCILLGTARSEDGNAITGSRIAFIRFMHARGCLDYVIGPDGKVKTALISEAATLAFIAANPAAASFTLQVLDVPTT